MKRQKEDLDQRSALKRKHRDDSFESVIRNLQRENQGLFEEINILKAKGKKVVQLQQKIDMILKHNNQLLIQNERLAKLQSYKKQEIEAWRNKHEQSLTNRSMAVESEIKRLMSELERVRKEYSKAQRDKVSQLNILNDEHHREVQQIKRTSLNNEQAYKFEIKQLKQLLCKQEEQINKKEFKFQKNISDMSHKMENLQVQKRRLDSRMKKEEQQHSKILENTKNKICMDFSSEIQILSKQHMHQLEQLHYENAKLKQALDFTNKQLKETLQKQNKVKNNYENIIAGHLRQKDRLKEKIIESQQIAEIQLSHFKEKMDVLKSEEIKILMNKSAEQFSMLNDEIFRLADLLRYKQQELESLVKEKKQTRSLLQAELSRMKVALDRQQKLNEEMKNNFDGQVRLFSKKFEEKNQQILTLQKYHQTRFKSFEEQKKILNQSILQKQKQIKDLRDNKYQIEKRLQIQTKQFRDFRKTTTEEREQLQKEMQEDLQEIHQMNGLKLMQLQRKNDCLVEEVKSKEKHIHELENNLVLCEKQIQSHQAKTFLFQSIQRDMRSSAKQNALKWSNHSEEQTNQLKSQFLGLNLAKNRQIEELKSIHDNKLRSLKRQISDFQKELDDKNLSLQKLKQQHQKLMTRLEVVFKEQSVKKNKDIKVPGLLPKELASKSLFDVFLKNKVLEYCS